MGRVLVSLMCHPEREPKVEVPLGDGYETFLNRTPNYAEAYRMAMAKAVQQKTDLVTADSDGYHPLNEIVKLATGKFYVGGAAIVLPYRTNLGWQSKTYSFFFSILERRRVRDATGGLCRLSYEFMRTLPSLKSPDMTIHIEILKRAMESGARIVQYGYLSGANEEAQSKRTSHYQLKLLRAAFA